MLRFARAAMFAAVFAIAVPFSLISLTGCGDSNQSGGTVVPPAPQAEQANKNMEDFMKSQGKKK